MQQLTIILISLGLLVACGGSKSTETTQTTEENTTLNTIEQVEANEETVDGNLRGLEQEVDSIGTELDEILNDLN